MRRNFVGTSNSPPSAFPKMPPCGSSMVLSPWVCCSDFAPTSGGIDGLIWVHPGAATQGSTRSRSSPEDKDRPIDLTLRIDDLRALGGSPWAVALGLIHR